MGSKSFPLLSVMGLLLALTVSRGEPVATYFCVPDVTNATPYEVLVEDVLTNGPAHKAGLRTGDYVLALDGIRCRAVVDFGTYIKYFSERSTIHAAIRRGTTYKTLEITDIPDTRLTGCMLRDQGPSIWKMLHERWNIKPEQILDLPAKAKEDAADPVAGIVEAFAVMSPPAISPLVTQVAYFPPRAQEALWVLGAAPTDVGRNWVIGLLKVYCALAEQRYGEVDALIARYGLRKSIRNPFLDGLVGFYARVAQSPPSLERGIPIKTYDVDPIYFAMCYPFPIVPERRTEWFSFDPAFANVFDKATSGDQELREELYSISMGYLKFDFPVMEEYLATTKAAITAQRDMGGWPYRHSAVYSKGPSLKSLLAALKENLDKKPEEGVLTAFALLAPSLMADDLATFANSYRMIFDAGTRELGTANSIIDQTLRCHHMERPNHRAVQQAINNSLPIPEIYILIARLSPDFKTRAQLGYFFRYEQYVEDLGGYCKGNPAFIAKSLAGAGNPTPLPPAVKDAGP